LLNVNDRSLDNKTTTSLRWISRYIYFSLATLILMCWSRLILIMTTLATLVLIWWTYINLATSLFLVYIRVYKYDCIYVSVNTMPHQPWYAVKQYLKI
jgi:hypothetical protein